MVDDFILDSPIQPTNGERGTSAVPEPESDKSGGDSEEGEVEQERAEAEEGGDEEEEEDDDDVEGETTSQSTRDLHPRARYAAKPRSKRRKAMLPVTNFYGPSTLTETMVDALAMNGYFSDGAGRVLEGETYPRLLLGDIVVF